MNDWISVEDKLPEIDCKHGAPACHLERLLVWPRYSHKETAIYFEDCGFALNGTRLKWVTHWMPLPDGPVLEEQ